MGTGITKYVLKHPVTTVMALLCLIVFGITSVFSAKLEQMPDMETPMLIVRAGYSGAGPEDICELVTEPIEDAISTLEGVKTMSSTSSDGSAMVMLEYDYGTDMDEAYDNLKKKLENAKRNIPDDVDTSIMEMSMNAGTTMMLSISHSRQENLYDYVDQNIVPEFERISSVAEVSAMGGSSEYIKIAAVRKAGAVRSDHERRNLGHQHGQSGISLRRSRGRKPGIVCDDIPGDGAGRGTAGYSNCYRHRRAGYAVGCSQYL